jgi:hypothetical protein
MTYRSNEVRWGQVGGGSLAWHGAVSIGGRGWQYGASLNPAPTTVWPGDHIFCTQDGFHESLTLTESPGQWVPKWPCGGLQQDDNGNTV